MSIILDFFYSRKKIMSIVRRTYASLCNLNLAKCIHLRYQICLWSEKRYTARYLFTQSYYSKFLSFFMEVVDNAHTWRLFRLQPMERMFQSSFLNRRLDEHDFELTSHQPTRRTTIQRNNRRKERKTKLDTDRSTIDAKL
jgi:hypothetical protein